MKKIFLAVAIMTSALGVACMWDYDTLRMETAGKMDVVHVLTGRFERWPDRYYEMRLERMVADLERGGLELGEELDRYDNAAVALDRLKRHDEAVEMIERKHARLTAVDPERNLQKDHWYRYYANAGTLYAHRWFANGADREKMAGIERGRDLIAKAIELNPDAHFGREDVQLAVMDWVIELDESGVSLASYDMRDIPSERAQRGLVGLVMLGNAWESVDVFEAIGHVTSVQLRDGAIGELAFERVRELQSQGKKSLVDPDELLVESRLTEPARVRAEYKELRADADAWAAEREAFVLKRLGEGKHPDTDKDFWEGYNERPPRPLDRDSLAVILNHTMNRRPEIVVFGLLGILVVLVTLAVRARRHRR